MVDFGGHPVTNYPRSDIVRSWDHGRDPRGHGITSNPWTLGSTHEGTPFEHPFSALFRPIGDGVPRSLLVTIPPRSSPYGALDRHDVSSPRTHGKSCDWWIGPSKSDVKNSRFSPLFNRVFTVLPKMAIFEKPCLCKVVTVKVKTCQKCHIPA